MGQRTSYPQDWSQAKKAGYEAYWDMCSGYAGSDENEYEIGSREALEWEQGYDQAIEDDA